MFLRSQLFETYGHHGIFSRRHGGYSPAPWDSLNLGLDLGDQPDAVHSNLERLCDNAKLPMPHRSVQVHGTDVLCCQDSGMQHDAAADVLISTQPHCTLAVRTADCLPILLVDTQHGIHAAVHAGWRGSAAQIVHIAVQQMQQRGAQTSSILASLGPCIQSCCFEVDHNTAQALEHTHPKASQAIRYNTDKAYPDLQAINRLQLLASGILPKHIETFPICTCCTPEHFFSWRRDGKHSGRMLAIVQA